MEVSDVFLQAVTAKDPELSLFKWSVATQGNVLLPPLGAMWTSRGRHSREGSICGALIPVAPLGFVTCVYGQAWNTQRCLQQLYWFFKMYLCILIYFCGPNRKIVHKKSSKIITEVWKIRARRNLSYPVGHPLFVAKVWGPPGISRGNKEPSGQ